MSSVTCSYCNKELGVFSRKNDYILCKCLYQRLKVLGYIHGQYKVKLDDERNIAICCKECAEDKGIELLVPDWSDTGRFSYFYEDDLRGYADYFYVVSYPLMHMFREAIPEPGAEESMVAVEEFRSEYEWRKQHDLWAIGSQFTDRQVYDVYKKSAMESRKWL